MKRRFLLDVMVLYFAIKGEREGQVADPTCAQLLELIGENCHGIVADSELRRRYDRHLSELFAQPRYQVRAALVFANLVYNPTKFVIETAEPPEISNGVTLGMPREDEYVVRAGLISCPTIVTAEMRLLTWINKNSTALNGLTAINPAEALALARVP